MIPDHRFFTNLVSGKKAPGETLTAPFLKKNMTCSLKIWMIECWWQQSCSTLDVSNITIHYLNPVTCTYFSEPEVDFGANFCIPRQDAETDTSQALAEAMKRVAAFDHEVEQQRQLIQRLGRVDEFSWTWVRGWLSFPWLSPAFFWGRGVGWYFWWSRKTDKMFVQGFGKRGGVLNVCCHRILSVFRFNTGWTTGHVGCSCVARSDPASQTIWLRFKSQKV